MNAMVAAIVLVSMVGSFRAEAVVVRGPMPATDFLYVMDNLETYRLPDLSKLRMEASRIDWRVADAPRELFELVVQNIHLNSCTPSVCEALQASVYGRYRPRYLKTAGKGKPTELVGLHFNPWENSIAGTFPEELKSSILEFKSRIHESDHAAVHANLSSQISSNTINILSVAAFSVGSHYLYLLEQRAMRAEWLYLSLVPKAVRRELAKKIREAEFPEFEAEAWQRWLTNSTLSVDEYLELEESAGRYPKSRARASVISDWKVLVHLHFAEPLADSVFCEKAILQSQVLR